VRRCVRGVRAFVLAWLARAWLNGWTWGAVAAWGAWRAWVCGWLRGCLGCLAAWLLGLVAAWLRGMLGACSGAPWVRAWCWRAVRGAQRLACLPVRVAAWLRCVHGCVAVCGVRGCVGGLGAWLRALGALGAWVCAGWLRWRAWLAWLLGRVRGWHGCVAAWLRGCVAVLGCVAAWLGCVDAWRAWLRGVCCVGCARLRGALGARLRGLRGGCVPCAWLRGCVRGCCGRMPVGVGKRNDRN
jgi:hypothetical protein